MVELLTARGKATISLVAEVEGTVVGHILFSPATLDRSPLAPRAEPLRLDDAPPEDVASSVLLPLAEQADHAGLGLAPVAVHPDFQNRGLGSALVRAGLAECRGLVTVRPAGPAGTVPSPAGPAGPTVSWIILLGHETYYPRFGFAPASRWNLTGDYGTHDAFQFLPLTAAANEIRGGHIRYAAEFGEIVG